MLIRLIVGVLILLTMAFLAACSNPPEVEPPPPIIDNYTGIYNYTEIRNGVDTVLTLQQLIAFIFGRDVFAMSLDPDEPDSNRVVCNVAGVYELGNGVDMACDLSNWPDSCGDTNIYPSGYFGLDQTTDTMRLLSDQTDSTGIRRIRQLRLVLIQ